MKGLLNGLNGEVSVATVHDLEDNKFDKPLCGFIKLLYPPFQDIYIGFGLYLKQLGLLNPSYPLPLSL